MPMLRGIYSGIDTVPSPHVHPGFTLMTQGIEPILPFLLINPQRRKLRLLTHLLGCMSHQVSQPHFDLAFRHLHPANQIVNRCLEVLSSPLFSHNTRTGSTQHFKSTEISQKGVRISNIDRIVSLGTRSVMTVMM